MKINYVDGLNLRTNQYNSIPCQYFVFLIQDLIYITFYFFGVKVMHYYLYIFHSNNIAVFECLTFSAIIMYACMSTCMGDKTVYQNPYNKLYTGSRNNVVIMRSTFGRIFASVQSVLFSLTPVKKCSYCKSVHKVW